MCPGQEEGAFCAVTDRNASQALLVDWRVLGLDRQNASATNAVAGMGAFHAVQDRDQMVALARIRGSIGLLRCRGVRIAVVSGDRTASNPPPYRQIEAIVGPVDVWCVASQTAPAPDGAVNGGAVEIRSDPLVVATAAQALGVELANCTVLTDDPDLIAGASTWEPGARDPAFCVPTAGDIPAAGDDFVPSSNGSLPLPGNGRLEWVADAVAAIAGSSPTVLVASGGERRIDAPVMPVSAGGVLASLSPG